MLKDRRERDSRDSHHDGTITTGDTVFAATHALRRMGMAGCRGLRAAFWRLRLWLCGPDLAQQRPPGA